MPDKSDQSPKPRDLLWRLPAQGLLIAFLTALLTGAVGYVYGLANDIRRSQLEFVNLQIERLYGPLLATTTAGKTTYRLLDQQGRSDAIFRRDNPPTVEQVREWRQWMRTVFQPLNLKMEELIMSNSHLIIGDSMPSTFSQVIAHTESFKALMANWTDSELSECTSVRRCSALAG